MKGSPEVIALMQKACDGESLAYNQYTCDAEYLDNIGMTEFADYMRKELAGEEDAHLKRFIARLVLLDAKPSVSPAPTVGHPNIKALLEHSLGLEQDTVKLYRGAYRTACADDDPVTARLFQEILSDEEDHVNYLEGQLRALKATGQGLFIGTYLEVPET